MNNGLTSPSTPTGHLRQTRGGFGFIRALATAAEHFFQRLYRGLGPEEDNGDAQASQKMEELLRWQQQYAEVIRARAADRARFNAILNRIGEGVIMQDMEQRILVINQIALNLIGGQKAFWNSLLARLSEQAVAVRTLPSQFEPLGEPVRVEINDRVLAAQVAAVGDEQGHPLGTVIVLHDITRDTLADRLKDEFITQVSHELRTPLTAIKGMSDVLLTQPPNRPPNRRFLEAISRNVDVLDRMIVELLDISEISSGTFTVKREPLLLDELLWSVIRGLEPRWKRAGLEVHFMPVNVERITLLGDNRRLRWAFGHLLENSINYTLPGGTITVQVGKTSQSNDYLLVYISDTGVGITAYDLPRVFERFYRGEARAPDGRLIDPRGLGQGLFVARAVARAHGGYLKADSKVNVGTTMTMGLPLGEGVASLAIEETALDAEATAPNPYLFEPPLDTEATAPNPYLALPPESQADTRPSD